MESTRLTLQLRTFERLLAEYDHKEPLARFLTLFFKRNKQMGSNDRRRATRWAYNYFRLGKALLTSDWRERLLIAEYLCHRESELVAAFDEKLSQSITDPLAKKFQLLNTSFSFQPSAIFPFLDHAAEGLNQEQFLESLFTQPDLFIRVPPKEKVSVLEALNKRQISYQIKDEFGIALPNGTKLDQLTELRGKYQIQDLSSQRTATFFEAKAGEQWWDACAASGGKSLLLLQTYPGVKLLVSDIRPSILRNLDERFDHAGISDYRRKIIDLTRDPQAILGREKFDGILLDAPCSGSGTWGRTPERMHSFQLSDLHRFVDLQRRIAENVIKHLKVGGTLIYMTCSLYAEENERQIAYLEQHGMKLQKRQLLKGYEEKADTMFVARLIKDND